MKNITRLMQDIYVPKKAFILHESLIEQEYYMESYDMDENGCPINARPLTPEESDEIAGMLQSRSKKQLPFLSCAGLLPDNLLYLDSSNRGGAIWYTKPRKMPLFFKPELSIPCGKAWIPPLVWKADKSSLYIYALQQTGQPTLKTPLCKAPFFNVYEDGRVCMGTVDIDIADQITLEQFMQSWEHYFFHSYFSHVLGGQTPVEGNIIQLWQEQVSSHKKFPLHLLKPQNSTLKKLLP